MQKKIYFVISCILFIPLALPAQNKLLSIDEAVMKGRSSLAPERLSQLMWIEGSNSFSFVGKRADKEVLIRGSVESSSYDTLMGIDDLNKSLKNLDTSLKAMHRFPFMSWLSAQSYRFFYNQAYYIYNLENKKCFLTVKLPGEAANIDLDPVTNAAAYTIDNNLFVMLSATSIAQASSSDNKGIVSGQTVHRNEFGIDKGTFWSPKGKYLALYRMDESMVDEYPLVDLSSKPAAETPIRYPMAGKSSHQVKIGIFESSSSTVYYLKTGFPSDQYLTNISWRPDETAVYVAHVNREQNRMALNEYNPVNGEFIRTLFEERSDKYVEPENPMLWVKNKPEQFIWQSERDGYNHLYLYNKDGKLIRQLTKGAWMVTEILGFDAKGDHVFIQATKESPIERHIYSVNLSNGKINRISANVPGTHTALFSSNGEYFLDTYSSISVPRKIDLIKSSGEQLRNLLNAPDPLAAYKMPEMSLFTIKAADGVTDLHCRLFKPINFDENKKYPTLVYLYGGPHLQLINNTFLGGADLWLAYMAQQGYVVFSLDNRGSANRGLAFEQVVHKRLGTNEMDDQMQGVQYLRSLKFVDPERLGVYGWSFGGFMSTSLMLRKAGVFKTAVAGGPVIDWSMYEVMYTERYMSTPQENKAGYDEANLLNYVGNLKGKLLMIHGTADDVVVWQHSLRFLEECVKKGVLVDYFVYPGHKHNVLGPDRVHLMKKITQYFKDNL